MFVQYLLEEAQAMEEIDLESRNSGNFGVTRSSIENMFKVL